jgi:hypothetical protein
LRTTDTTNDARQRTPDVPGATGSPRSPHLKGSEPVYLIRPAFGEPCNGCGWCCREEVCELGVRVFAGAKTPCPFLREHHGRTWCGVVEEAAEKNIAFGAHLAWQLGIGRGCLVTS